MESDLSPSLSPPNNVQARSRSTQSVGRRKGLLKLGVSEDDVELAEMLLRLIPKTPSDPNKAERILGYASMRLHREKALRLLGMTEEEIEEENAKVLGSLGTSGRRRSFSNPEGVFPRGLSSV
ncbi:hypothetical protein ACHAXH_001497 [Discostella pseudostelligera]